MQPTHASSLTTQRRTLLRIACIALGAFFAAAIGTPAVAQTLAAADAKPPRVELATTLGKIVVELDSDKAPISASNFLTYVRAGFYDGTVFHRVIPTFMIQGGGFTPDMRQKPTRAPITIESQNGLKNVRGSVAMARTSDPNSATSQFFINVVDNARLDYPSFDGHGYAVFGRVVDGMGVVEKIRRVETKSAGQYENVPTAPVVITTARVL